MRSFLKLILSSFTLLFTVSCDDILSQIEFSSLKSPVYITLNSLSPKFFINIQSNLPITGECKTISGGVHIIANEQLLKEVPCVENRFNTTIPATRLSVGRWIFRAEVNLPQKTGKLEKIRSFTYPINIETDTIPPTINIISPVTGNPINTRNESNILVNGTCSESGRDVTLSQDLGILTCNSGGFSGRIDFSSLSDGIIFLTASQTDLAGNTGTSSPVSLTKDTSTPTVTITSPSTDTTINTSNESSLLVTGTCSENGRTVSLSQGTGTLTCNGDNFSGSIDFSAISDGTFSLTASQTDLAGNTGLSNAVPLTKDTEAPTVTITSPVTGTSINTTNESSLLVTGTCSESGRSVTLSQGLGALNCNRGNFSRNIDFSSLSDGTFSLTASQTDASNNTGTSSAVSLTKDTGLPTVTITSPTNGTTMNTANESSLLVTGTCSESGRTVSLSHGTGTLTCNGGTFSGNINFSAVSDGSISLTASQTDASNNTGTSSAVSLTKDTSAPTVTITSPSTGTTINTTNESSLLVTGTCSENGRAVSLSHGVGTLTCNAGNFSSNIDFSSLSDGSISLTASQTDASNNTGTSSAVSLTKDTGLPTVTITSPTNGTTINTANESSLLVTGTCSESGRGITLSHGTGTLTCNAGNFSGNINFSAVSDGSISLTASQTDASNNTGTSSAVSLTKDTSAPTVTITSPTNGTTINTTNESSLTLSGTCSESGRGITLSHGTGTLTCNSGNFSGNINFSAVSDGTFLLTASQTDASNNTGTSSAVSLTKDTGLPTVTITSPSTGTTINTANESSLLVSGTCSESGRAVSLSQGLGALNCNSGNFSGNIDFSSLSDGSISLTASQADSLGNIGTSSAVSLTKDTGLPTVTITSPTNGTTINTANESSLLVTGTCSENALTVSLSQGSGTLTCNAGNFSGNINFSAVSDGTFSLTASQTDASNNTGTSSAVSLTKDTSNPTVTITSPTNSTTINTANESSLLVSGTCSESGRGITLSHGTGTLTCNSGNFSGNINFSAVSDGTFSLTVSQTDASNNTGTSSAVSLTKDTGLPTVTITSPSTGTTINTANESSLTLSGTCSESGRTVSLSHGVGTLTCNGGNFSGHINFSSISDGSISLTASQTDASNNTGTSSAVSLTKDTGLPTVTIANPATGSSINIANVSSLLVSGTCSENALTVSLSHGVGTLTCNSGTFSGHIDFSTVSDGSISLTASQTDASNNTGTSSAVSLTKDTRAPTIAITSPTHGAIINTANESSFTLSGTCSESGRTVSLSHGVGTLTCNGGNFSGHINFSSISDGSISLTASQTDASNNTGTSSAVSLTKDTGLPTVTIANPATGSSINIANVSSLLVSGTCSENALTVSLSHGVGTLTCNSGTFSGHIDFSTVSDGSISLTASQTDASNNTGTSSAVSLTKDTRAPTIAITSPTHGAIINTANESSFLVSGTCSESERTVSLSHGTGTLTCNGGTFSGHIDFSSVVDGTILLTASLTDPSGNSSTSNSINLIKDTVPPAVNITHEAFINIANQSNFSVTVTCLEIGQEVVLSPGVITITSACNGTTLSAEIDFSSIADGLISLMATQTDLADNTGTSSVVLTKDTVAPTISITSPVEGSFINTTNESNLLVEGTCSEDGRAVSLSHGTGTLTCNSGTFSGNINFSSVSDGSISLTASQTDASNNTGTSSAVSLTKDTSAPTVTITSPSTDATINTANESSLLVEGTCSESGRTVSLSQGLGTLTCSSNNFSGNINFSSVSDGTFLLTASQTDASNNTGTSSAVSLTKDTRPPTVTITSPANGTTINTANASNLTLSGTCSESGRTVSLSHGVGTLTCISNNFSGNINFRTVSDGSISLTASQTDASNNTGTSSPVSLTKDTGGTMTSVWQTARSNEVVELPLKSGFNYNFRINWGDGSSEAIVTSYNDTDKTHTYATAGDYTITITGLVEAWGSSSYSNPPYQSQIIEVSDLGDMGWKNLSYAFFKCKKLTTVSGGNTSKVTKMNNMFFEATNANPDVSDWDTSKVTDMATMFYKATNAHPDVRNWDTSKVTDMKSMFQSATSAHPDVRNWDTSKVTRMDRMFHEATSANPDVSNWDTSKVTDMHNMFSRATNANPDVSNWDTSKVISMNFMFYAATNANPDVRNWDTSKVTRMDGMFFEATNANPDVRNWETSKVTRMKGMFFEAISAHPDVSNWDTSEVTTMENMFSHATNANPNVSNWNTSKVTNMGRIFHEATSAHPDVRNWDTSKVTDMASMFSGATSANPDVRNWDTSKVTDMKSMFSHATNANPDVSNWDTSKVTRMDFMFREATNANPDVRNWDTSKVTDMATMFYKATNANPDVRNWDTSKVTSMTTMFSGAISAHPDVSNWDISKVTNMASMFSGATNANPDVINWDTSKVTNMRGMFSGATSAHPDVSNWDTSKVTDMASMFSGATNANPDVSNWDTSKVIWMDDMFHEATSAHPDVSNWDTSEATNMKGMFYGATSANPDFRNFDFTALRASGTYRSFVHFIQNSGISTSNYSNLLINLDSQEIHESAIPAEPFISPAQYNSSAVTARASLLNKGWIISDRGLESP